MSGAHSHDHDGGDGHAHVSTVSTSNERSVAIAALLTGGFMLAEIAGGLVSGSLALLADAGHMLTDVAALTLAWIGFRLARRPADEARTYGFDRFSVLAAFVNGISLFAIAAWIVVEAVRRLREPPEVLGGLMLGVATIGLAVNVVSFWILSRSDQENLNIRAAFLHVLGDLLGSLAAIAASLIILFTGWAPADPLLSIVVAAIILRAAWRVVTDSGRILMEATPRGVDPAALVNRLLQIDGVEAIAHVHLWAIAERRRMATLEAVLSPTAAPRAASAEIKRVLREEFAVGHATIETTTEQGVDAEAACKG